MLDVNRWKKDTKALYWDFNLFNWFANLHYYSPLISNIIEVIKYIQLCNLIIILSTLWIMSNSKLFEMFLNYTFVVGIFFDYMNSQRKHVFSFFFCTAHFRRFHGVTRLKPGAKILYSSLVSENLLLFKIFFPRIL